MIRASIAVEEALLVLKVVFLVLLYLFIWRIVRRRCATSRFRRRASSSRRARSRASAAARSTRSRPASSTVLKSPALDEGDEWELDSRPLTLGRGAQNDVPLDKDEYASSSHARIEPRRDGVWVEDIGSTNGTYLNGIRLTRPKRLTPGDVVRVGETELRYDA